jgi:serine protease Do
MTVDEGSESRSKQTRPSGPHSASAISVIGSTITSLTLILALLVVVRWLLPPLLESSRYSWFRGQLRAEHEAAGEQLRNVSLDGLSRVSQLVSQRVNPSVVHLDVKQALPWNHSLLRESEQDTSDLGGLRLNSQGSGILVDREGYVLTNFHVLDGCESVEIVFSDESHEEAVIVGVDRARDLAVLKVKPVDLPEIEWGDSNAAEVGSPVWALGSPFGLHGSVTFGILSSKHRVDLGESFSEKSGFFKAQYSDLMQSDVALNPGNSGGPLVNGKGQLIGVNTAILGDTFQGVSFSIPSNLAKQLYQQIREKAKSPRGWLGVILGTVKSQATVKGTPENKDDPSVDDTGSTPATGALVVDFAKFGRSPARDAGVVRGDVVVELNGRAIVDHKQLIETIQTTKPESQVELTVLRKGKRSKLTVTLGARFVEIDPSEKMRAE